MEKEKPLHTLSGVVISKTDGRPIANAVVALAHADRGIRGKLAKLYNVSSTPATFLIGHQGQVVATNLHGKRLSSAVRKAVGEASPTPAEGD